MDVDLNQEPLDIHHGSILSVECLINELETTHGHIEERIRQLEAVISRARQRQRWRQSLIAPQTLNVVLQATASEVQSDDAMQERISEPTKIVNLNTGLIAKALGLDSDATKLRRDNKHFFDCNICLGLAREPVLTCCGHLFCWPCFYTWPYGHSNVIECPVCMEEVADTSVVPIYGCGNDSKAQNFCLTDSGVKIPPRPRAQRIENVRHQRGNRRAINRNPWQFNQITPAVHREGGQHHRSDRVSSALNSAMDSAERLVQSHPRRQNNQRSSNDFDRDSFSSIAAVVQEGSDIPHNAVDADSTAGQSLSVEHLENRSMNVVPIFSSASSSSRRRAELTIISQAIRSVDVDSTASVSSASRRRSQVPGDSDVENDPYHNHRRRRLM